MRKKIRKQWVYYCKYCAEPNLHEIKCPSCDTTNVKLNYSKSTNQKKYKCKNEECAQKIFYVNLEKKDISYLYHLLKEAVEKYIDSSSSMQAENLKKLIEVFDYCVSLKNTPTLTR